MLIMVDDVAAEHGAFVAGLRACWERVPTAGLPRITRLRRGQYRFGVFDPSGNALLVIAHDERVPDYSWGDRPGSSHLLKALATASWLRDLKGFDDVGAARVLDIALAKPGSVSAPDRARALAARAELALALGEQERSHALRAELATLPLAGSERDACREEFLALEELERLLQTDSQAADSREALPPG